MIARARLITRTFSTSTNLWSATTVVATTNWTDFGQGDEGVALAVDSNGMPHAVWSGNGSDGRLHVFYGNKGGSWAAQQVDDITLTGNRRALHPTVAFTAANALVVAWLEGTFNYVPDGIIRVRTRDVNGNWAATQTITDPDGAMTTIDNGPSLLVTPDGAAASHLPRRQPARPDPLLVQQRRRLAGGSAAPRAGDPRSLARTGWQRRGLHLRARPARPLI